VENANRGMTWHIPDARAAACPEVESHDTCAYPVTKVEVGVGSEPGSARHVLRVGSSDWQKPLLETHQCPVNLILKLKKKSSDDDREGKGLTAAMEAKLYASLPATLLNLADRVVLQTRAQGHRAERATCEEPYGPDREKRRFDQAVIGKQR